MRQKDYYLSHCKQRQAQSAVLVATIATRYSQRHKHKSSFSSATALTISVQSFTAAQNQVTLLLDRATRIAETEFRFNFNRFSDREALSKFRFRQSDIVFLVPVLSWPVKQTHTARNRYGVTPVLATCILLRRMAVPDRWEDLCFLFGKHPSQMSEIFWEAMDHFVAARGHLLLSPVPQAYMESRVTAFSKAVSDKGGAMQNCIGFIDGTVIGIARPKGYMSQLVVYNGHKRKHALKYQAIITPDGMILHAYGPVEGRRHDWYLYHCSGKESNLEQILQIDGVQCMVYGDSGYNWRVFMEVPFQGSNLNNNQSSFNTSMSKVRVTVEWIFKEMKMFFPVVETKRKMKLWESPVEILYLGTMLMSNIRNCFYANQISAYFGVKTPALEDYIAQRAPEVPEEFFLPARNLAEEKNLSRSPAGKLPVVHDKNITACCS